MVIDLKRRIIQLDDGPQLFFHSESNFFYLQVIALVAHKMKDRTEEVETPYVSIDEIEEQAWALSAEKLFKNRESMRTMIYQTWRKKLKYLSTECIYDVAWPDGKDQSVDYKRRLNELFRAKVGRGPKRAGYQINEDPSNIEIVIGVVQHHAVGNRLFDASSLEGVSDKQKVKILIDALRDAVTPATYSGAIAVSQDAIRSLLAREEICCLDEKGMLKLSVEDYACAYVELIGVSGVRGDTLMTSWLKELIEDPWWQQLILPGNDNPNLYRDCLDKPITLRMCRNSQRIGDVFLLLWLFHRAYINSVVVTNRDALISALKDQNQKVQEGVYTAWAEHFHCSDYTMVKRQVLGAFRDLQKLTMISLKYR
jgi:hypothetical protein